MSWNRSMDARTNTSVARTVYHLDMWNSNLQTAYLPLKALNRRVLLEKSLFQFVPVRSRQFASGICFSLLLSWPPRDWQTIPRRKALSFFERDFEITINLGDHRRHARSSDVNRIIFNVNQSI